MRGGVVRLLRAVYVFSLGCGFPARGAVPVPATQASVARAHEELKDVLNKANEYHKAS